jgi:hypothetical protein
MTGPGRIARSGVLPKLVVQADPVRIQNGHEIGDFTRQIEAEYRKLNGR